MRSLLLSFAVLLSGVCHSEQHSTTPAVACNPGHNTTVCDIDIPVTLSSDRRSCTADPAGILTYRNPDSTRWVKLTWVLPPRFSFDPSRKGVDINDVHGHFDHKGPDGARKYRWEAKNPPGTLNMSAAYEVHVQYEPGHGQPPIPCAQIDPLIINRD